MMDVSDGIANDVGALTTDGLAAALRETAIPVGPAARALARKTGRSPLDHALADGEDYELLVVVRTASGAARLERDWPRQFPALPLTPIGTFVRAGRLPAGAINLANCRGYEHLR